MTAHFEDCIKEAVAAFKQAKPFVARIVANQNADGIAAAGLLMNMLQREHIKFVVTIVRQMSAGLVEELKKEHYDTYFFVDLGSSHVQLLDSLKRRHIFVFDHHAAEQDAAGIFHLNPQLYDVDGLHDIAAAGVAYLFARALNEENKDQAYLALVGAIGDGQERNGFSGYNQDFLDTAVATQHVVQKHDLRIFGVQTKPLYKALEYSTSPYIPGVTGNEKEAQRFLEKHGVIPLDQGKGRHLRDLSEAEVKKLIVAITTQRKGSDENDEVYGPVYLLASEPYGSMLQDLREFSTLLNCCARMRKGGLGLGVCMGSMASRARALELHSKYVQDIISSLHWFYQHKGKENYVEEYQGYVIFNAEEAIKDSLLGTLCSLISRSNIYPDGTILIGSAHGLDDYTKISARIAGANINDLHAGKILEHLTQKFSGQAGGHSFAAGATIPKDQEQAFLLAAKEFLQQYLAIHTPVGS